jgi:hypothetical protein
MKISVPKDRPGFGADGSTMRFLRGTDTRTSSGNGPYNSYSPQYVYVTSRRVTLMLVGCEVLIPRLPRRLFPDATLYR